MSRRRRVKALIDEVLDSYGFLKRIRLNDALLSDRQYDAEACGCGEAVQPTTLVIPGTTDAPELCVEITQADIDSATALDVRWEQLVESCVNTALDRLGCPRAGRYIRITNDRIFFEMPDGWDWRT